MEDNYIQIQTPSQYLGRGMSELGVMRASPDSDCNSNLRASYLSTTSSQDVDFVQDNSDYQWFLDYGYKDGGTNHHTSILSLPETYEAGDNYYDALAKNMDANLAEADMESFKTEDIHALLTNLPPMCTDHLSQEANRQGECFAEVSGSLMGKFDLDSFISPHSSSQGEDCSANSTSMSICKSELLFSPVKETPMPGANFSVDSLDCDLHDMMLTCQANKDNYTIAFEGSVTMYSEDSDYHDTDKSSTNSNPSNQSGSLNMDVKPKNKNIGNLILEGSMTQSDSSGLTTWSKLKKRSSDDHLRRPSGNNNNSEDEGSHLASSEIALKSQSLPNLHKERLKKLVLDDNSHSNSSETNTVKQRPVKLFNIHHQIQSSSGSGSFSEMATSVDASSCEGANNKHPNLNLVKLFMKQKSISQEGMSLTTDHLSSSDNWPGSQSGESSGSDQKNGDRNLELSSDPKTIDSSARTYDLIAEEPEDVSKSESIEQLSESVSRAESACGSYGQQQSINNNDTLKNHSRSKIPTPRHFLKLKNDLHDRSIQTSQFSEILNLKKATNLPPCLNVPFKLIEPSFLSKLKKEGEVEKPVYVLYPNYVLPNLDFLNEKNNVENVLFVPQSAPKVSLNNRRRPFSFNDIEVLKRRGFGHVKDWDSLNVLLPQEYRKILADVPEISSHIKPGMRDRPSFLRSKKRPLSCEIMQNNISSSSSTATQPSSGYRGSSSILTDSQNSPAAAATHNPLFVYRYDSVTSSEASLLNSDKQAQCIMTTPHCALRTVHHQECAPPRPPLPRGILRKAELNKRYSMYETSEEDLPNEESQLNKRKSVPEPYFLNRDKRFSETEDEGVDAGTSSSSMDEKEILINKPEYILPHMSTDELLQLEEYLKLSGFSSGDEEKTEESLTHLRSYVSKFLALKINQDDSEHFGGKKSVSFAEKLSVNHRHLDPRQGVNHPPNNSPNVSAFLLQRNFQPKTVTDMTICEENENSPNYSSPQATPIRLCKTASDNYVQKRSLINGVMDAVDQVMQHFSPASDQQELNVLGDSSVNPASAKLTLTTLCPALYAVLSDGLKPCLETSFGAINNSVWQVVEASSQQGPLTKALNDLVMKINSEDVISEGLVKFNAFIFGLLNVRSLDAWISYLRTRESVLKKHYTADSLLLLSHTGGTNLRTMLDAMVAALQPLAFLPFQFDLLFEYKQLHLSFKRMDSYHQPSSPTLKYSPSNVFKQFVTAKYSNSRSNSESDDLSAATIKNLHLQGELLNSSGNSSASRSRRNDRERPRSCMEPGVLAMPSFKLGEDVNNVAKKRWSTIGTNSKMYQVYDRLAQGEEEYADSLEGVHLNNDQNRISGKVGDVAGPESLDSNYSDEKPINGRRFRKLQQKWEMLSGRDSVENDSPPPSPTHSNAKSKIPRPITSPVKPSGIPVLISPPSKSASNKKITSPQSSKQTPGSKILVKNSPAKKVGPRTSRMDQVESSHEVQRPSSLPYRPASQNAKNAKVVPQRRAVSSSLNRRPVSSRNVVPKRVRTLKHRLPSESGHLSYNEGEILKVVLEVDDKWLLCCRGTQKGLVPKSAVIAENERF